MMRARPCRVNTLHSVRRSARPISARLALLVEVVTLQDRLHALERDLCAGGRFAGAVTEAEEFAIARVIGSAISGLEDARPRLA